MSLIGACLSTEKTDQDQAMAWVDAVEEWIFSDPDFSEERIPQTCDESEISQVETRLDALRAAYALVLVMTWEGCESQMKRARRTRFSQVICVARSLYYFVARGRSLHGEPSFGEPFSPWRFFALKEECIRLLSYVFLLDCAFVMLNHTAPRMVTRELQFRLASPDACFHAPELDTWLRCMEEWEGTTQLSGKMALSEAIEMIMKCEPGSMEWHALEQTSTLNLFAISSGTLPRSPGVWM